MENLDIDLFRNQLCCSFECKTIGSFLRIRTNSKYPDGDYVDLFFDPKDSCFTDLGESFRWMKYHSGSILDSEK